MCYKPTTIAMRFYVIAPYGFDEDGHFRASPIDRCPLNETQSENCKLYRDHGRFRKTGSRHSLCVMRCRTHGILQRCFMIC